MLLAIFDDNHYQKSQKWLPWFQHSKKILAGTDKNGYHGSNIQNRYLQVHAGA